LTERKIETEASKFNIADERLRQLGRR
jgi:hypothetical protein